MSDIGVKIVINDGEEDDETEDDLENKDIVRKLELEFATPKPLPNAKCGTSVNFDPKKDHMRVFLRIRPFSENELNKGENQKCIENMNAHTIMAHAPKDSHTYKNSLHGNSYTKAHHKFTFSNIFPDNTSQKEFFDSCMLGTVKEFVDGQNCLVFTYGVTNSGKTYTIQGEAKDGGILPRALDVLFNSIAGKQVDRMDIKPKMFCDVVLLTPNQEEQERIVKDTTLKMASSEEPDVTSLIGGDISDISTVTVNSTMSDDSLMTRASILSTASTSKQSIDKDSLENIFEEAESRVRDEAAIDVDFQGQIKFSVWVTFAEIYNEQIYDLLEPPPKKKNARRTVLHLREDKNGVPYIRGLKEICVSSADEAYKILTIGKKNLQFSCTKLNHNSSRSHCIYTIKLLRVVDVENPNMARMSMLSFCDLAGSERYSKTQSMGERIKEAGNINTSLLTLGRCIKTLRYNQMNREHTRIVPFRESRLTRIFQSFFCGKGRASMIVNINQVASLFDETLHALKYSAIAKEVINIQEPEEEKKPPPPKKRGIVSMALSLGGRNRTTIGWATPGTMAKVYEEEEAGMNLPLPECDDDELEEPEEEEAPSDNAQVQVWMNIIEELNQQMLTEKRKNRDCEERIRAEVCREMATQLVEIEKNCSERVKEAQDLAEEKAEKKIELLTKSIKKTKKRKRIFDQEEDEEYVSSLLLHTEEIKVQDREKEITRLNKKIETLESQMKTFSEEKEALQEKFSKLEFEHKHLKDKLEEVTSMADEQYQLLKESREQVESLDERVRGRDNRIATLEQMLQSKDCDDSCDNSCRLCQEKIAEMGELISKLSDAEEALDAKAEMMEKMQQMADMLNCDASDKASRIEELESTLKEAQENKETRISDEKSESELSHFTELQASVDVLKEKILHLENSLSISEEKLQHVLTINTDLEQSVADQKDEKDQLEIKLSDSEKSLKNYLSELETVSEKLKYSEEKSGKISSDLSSLKESFDFKSLELNTTCKELLDCQSKLENITSELLEVEKALKLKSDEVNTLRNTSDLNEAMKERLNCLEEELAEAKEKVKRESESYKSQISELREKIASLQTVIQTKELDLTKCGTEMFEVLEKVSENETEFSKFTELLKTAEEEKTKLITEIDNYKVKIAGLECSLSMAEENAETIDELSEKNDSLQKELSQKERMIEKMALEVGKLRKSLDSESGNVTEIEASLHQANELLRSKALELTEVKAELTEKYEHIVDLQNTTKETTAQLEDYILKVNEQADNIGVIEDKYNLEMEKVKKLGSKLTNVECELGLLKTERLSEADNEAIEILQTTLQSEKEKHELTEKEIQAQLNGKIRILDQLNLEYDKLKKLYESERKECKECKSQLKELEQVFDNVEHELKNEKKSRKETKAESSKLQLKIHELENKLKDTQTDLQDANKNTDELEKKVCALQESLEMSADIEEELQEVKSQLEQITVDREKHLSRVKELQVEIEELRNAENKSQENRDEVVENLRTKIQLLQAKVDDAEYKNQMSSRQMRREKSQLEKLLKETENTLSEAEDRVSELESQVKDIKAIENELCEKKIEQSSKKAAKLEAVVQDLEHCLISSKESEVKAQNSAEEYRQKYRDLDSQYAIIEEQLKDLYDKRDSIASQKDHEEICYKTVLDQKQTEMERLRSTICDLREEIVTLQNAVDIQNDHDNSLICNELRDEISTLQEIIDRNTKDYGEQMFEKNEAIRTLETSVEKLNLKLNKADDQMEKRYADCKECKEMCNRLKVVENDLNEAMAEVEVKQCRVATLESDISQIHSEFRSNKEMHEKDLKEKTELLTVVEEELKTVRGQMDNLQQQYQTSESKVNDLEKNVLGKDERLEELLGKNKHQAEKLITVQGTCSELQEVISSLQLEQERVQESSNENSQVKCEVTTLKQQLEDVTKCKSDLESELSCREISIQNYNKRIASLKEEIEQLNDQLEKSQEEKSNLRGQMRDWSDKMQAENAKFVLLQENLTQSKNKLEESQVTVTEQISALNKNKSEIDQLNQAIVEKDKELIKVERNGQKRIDHLELEVTQLKMEIETKVKRIDKKNKRIAELLDEFQKEQNRYDIASKDAHANEQVIERLKKALEEQEQVMEMQDTHLKKKEDELDAVSKDLETVSEKYNVLLKESAESTSTLRQLEHLQKRASKDQSDQQQELHDLRQQVSQLKGNLETTEAGQAGTTKERDEVKKQLQSVMHQLSDVNSSQQERKHQLEKTEREKTRLGTDITECNRELREMEKSLDTARREREQLRRELEMANNRESEMKVSRDKLQFEQLQSEESRGQAQILKQKFHSLEEQKSQLEKEVDHLKNKLTIGEEKKELELQKWRSERDKLVGQLQEILVKKDEEITSLKEKSPERHETLSDQSMENLKIQLADKDAIIAELSSHLEKGAPKTRRGRGKKSQQASTSGGSDEEVESLRKELSSIYQKLESERQNSAKELDTVLRAKDGIICELKGTNRTLQSQMMHTPGGVMMEEPTCIQETPGNEESNVAVQCELDDSIPANTPVLRHPETVSKPPVKHKGKGRSRKRGSSETEQSETNDSEHEPITTKTKGSRGGKRPSTRQPKVRQKSLRLDENDEASMGVIREEDVVDLSMIDHNKSCRIFNNSTNLIDQSPLVINSTPKREHRTATFVSPITEVVPPSTMKKKRRLRKTEESEPFAASPNDLIQDHLNKDTDPHKIVTRKLRTRKK